MSTLRDLRDRLNTTVVDRLKKARRASLFVKISLLAVASAIVAVAQLAQVPLGSTLNTWQVTGIAASFFVAVGAVFIAITEDDASKELAIAADTIEQAQQYQDTIEELNDIFSSLDRTIELYQAVMSMRSSIEAMIASKISDDVAAASTLLTVSGRSLAIAMDFAQSDQWTICVFKAEIGADSRAQLRCIAHTRAIDCDLDKARVWDEGVGIAGVSYSNGGEVIIPDMTADGLRTVFASPKAEVRDYDDERYRSMAAMPIVVDGMERPWGIVVCTSDQAGHFQPDGTTGAKTHEGGRALSGMIALAVAAVRRSQE